MNNNCPVKLDKILRIEILLIISTAMNMRENYADL